MKVQGKHFKTVEMENGIVKMIDQNILPFEFKIVQSFTYHETCNHIRQMTVRGAGAIGVSAAFAMAQACNQANENSYVDYLNKAKVEIESTRPTARNLFYAVEKVYQAGLLSPDNAVMEAYNIAKEDEDACKSIGLYGNEIISPKANISTHCNAGWLAFVDYGSALSPIYKAHEMDKEIHVWVDETRPRSQGARLTAWELSNESIPHTIIPDNATAFLMQQGKIDIVVVGADRIAANGDTANKIGTLEKAIAAAFYKIPFYVAAPTSTFDINCKTGDDIPIEYRNPDEVLWVSGRSTNGKITEVLASNPTSQALNPAFDVTPCELITGFITEKGIIMPNRASIGKLILNK